ncbi:tyrosine--tRNA ligase [Candidatus Peregrinibacteria bacterium]|nr:tyrosine--tRNA ligase [Candidatus Peregrinibacteria bacterium]
MSKINKAAINDLLSRGVVDTVVKNDLMEKLKSGRKLRIKLGIDPSGKDLHIGHMVVIKKLKEFQDMGHQIILLFGNFTGQIGDPTGKIEARAAKSKQELEKNAEKYLDQVKIFLDIDKIEVRWNADWLEKLNFADVIRLASCFTVAQMMERDMFQDRVKKNIPISMHEFMYPLMQGYDSVALKADLELGGTDQTFNLLAGRVIQKAYGQAPQDILTVPILEGLDGVKKMGKSENNYIAVDDEPKDMFGKVMSIPDNLILKYFELATNIDTEEIKKYKKALKEGENPMKIKKLLGKEIVKIYHSEQASHNAEIEFTNVFSKNELPEDIEETTIDAKAINLVELIVNEKMAPSKSEARRLIEQGGVKIDQEKITDVNHTLDLHNEKLLQVGKRKFLKVKGT